MEILIDELKFAPGLLVDGLTAWEISGKKYRKKCFLVGMNVKM